MKYVCAALCAALLVMGWLYRSANNELADTKTSLAVALEANETNRKAIARLERSIENTDNILAGWNEDRTTLAGVRSATRQAIKEAMRDETFKAWASSLESSSNRMTSLSSKSSMMRLISMRLESQSLNKWL